MRALLRMMLVLPTVFLWGERCVAAGTPPSPPQEYRAKPDRSVSLTTFCATSGNWQAENKGKNVGGELSAARASGAGREGGDCLVFGVSAEPEIQATGRLIHSRTRRQLPVSLVNYNRLSVWVRLEGMPSACVVLGLERVRRHRQLTSRKKDLFSMRGIRAGAWVHLYLDFSDADVRVSQGLRYLSLGLLWFGRSGGKIGADKKQKVAEPSVRLYVDGIMLEHLSNPRKFAGSGADPAVVTVNALGYPAIAEKWAVVPASVARRRFYLRNAASGKVVFSGGLQLRTSSFGSFLLADFSRFSRAGLYTMQIGDLRSAVFPVGEHPWSAAAAAALAVVGGLRCGTRTALHAACHLDCFQDTAGKVVPLVGGYHFAGDLRRSDVEVLSLAPSLLDAAALPGMTLPMRKRLMNEVRWALALERKHLELFGRPRRVDAGTEKENHFTDNRPGTRDDYLLHEGTVSWNAEASAAFLRFSRMLEHPSPELQQAFLAAARKMATAATAPGRIRLNLELNRATGDARYDERLRGALDHWLAQQDHRVFNTPEGPISGFFPVVSDAGVREAVSAEAEIPAVAAVMREREDTYYQLYFALRRYADLYLKPISARTVPWTVPVAVSCGEHPFDLARWGPGARLGLAGGVPAYLHVGGKLPQRTPEMALILQQLAVALMDPAVESIARRMIGAVSGWNPFAFSCLYGFGNDTPRALRGAFPLTRGMAFPIPRNRLNRTAPESLDLLYQARTAAALAAIGAPCRIQGHISDGENVYRGKVLIRIPDGAVIRRLETDINGDFPPQSLDGGGEYLLEAGNRLFRFAAVSGAVRQLNFDIANEIRLQGRRVRGRLPRLVTEGRQRGGKKAGRAAQVRFYPVIIQLSGTSFLRLAAGVSYTLDMAAEALGDGRSLHTIKIHAANARVEPEQVTVEVRPGTPSGFKVKITPLQAGESLAVLMEIDGDHLKKWEILGMAESNSGYIQGRLRIGGVPQKGQGRIVDSKGREVAKIYLNASGRFAATAVPGGGTYRIRLRHSVFPLIDVEAGKLVTIDQDSPR